MLKVPRDRFVPADEKAHAYDDGPLPIGHGQTISQPYIVAYMTELLHLTGGERVLEIGTGSGYQAAVLAETGALVYTVELVAELSAIAQRLLVDELGYRTIFFRIGRGQDGWPEFAPFDRIILTASPREFPQPLFPQLADMGIAVAPVGELFQRIIRYRRLGDQIDKEELIGVSFVPLL